MVGSSLILIFWSGEFSIRYTKPFFLYNVLYSVHIVGKQLLFNYGFSNKFFSFYVSLICA